MAEDAHNVHPLKYLGKTPQNLGLIILNNDISHLRVYVEKLWSRSVVRGVADGGINRLHKAFNGDPPLPDYISGDFDSADPELLEFYRNKNVEIYHTADQDRTDFDKCLEIFMNKIAEKNVVVDCVVVLGGLGGRFDHEMSNVNTLIKIDKNIPVYLHGRESVVMAVKKGRTRIFPEREFSEEWCGLIPVERTVVTTRGLKWNLSAGVLEFGGMVSTSNKIVGEFVEVETDQCLLWTMGVEVKEWASL